MNKVMIISYYFPPDNEIGGIRIQGIAKYLPEFGWEAVILTKNQSEEIDPRYRLIQNSQKVKIISKYKEKMFSQKSIYWIKKKFRVSTHTSTKSIRYRLLLLISEIITYPDLRKDWYTFGFKQASSILENEYIDVIISSSMPHVCHMIANDLHSRYMIPWIADLRDLWTQNHYYQYSNVRKFFERRFELKILSNAEYITTVSYPLVEILKQLHIEKNICAIPNGFDPEMINNEQINLTEKFTITYTGILYQGKRKPDKLFQAINELILENKINAEKIKVVFYGQREDWVNLEINKYNLQNVVEYHDFIPRSEALKKQKEAQLLLLLMWNHPNEIGVYTGKLFDYLCARRPILAIGGQKSVVKELIEETNSGKYTTSVEELKVTIEDYYEEYLKFGYVPYKGIDQKINKYSQKEMARKFAQILNATIKK